MFTEVIDKAAGATVSGAHFNTYIAANLNNGLWVPQASSTVTGGSAPTSITFDAIPQSFYGLVVVGMVRSTVSATSEIGYFRFNGDTGSNYSRQRDYGGLGTGGAADEILSHIYVDWISVSGATATASTFSPMIMTIFDYSSSTLNKHGTLFQGLKINETATGMIVGTTGFHWASTSAITSITAGIATGYADNSELRLYGIGGTL